MERDRKGRLKSWPSVKSHEERVEEHYEAAWGPRITASRWEAGPYADLPSAFHVSVYRRASDVLVFATVGMSQEADESRLELHMLADSRASEHSSIVELLTVVAHYHRTGRRLGHGHTVNFGKPWQPGSTCGYGLLSLPYLDGTKVEWSPDPSVRFLWLIPITEAEREYKRRAGLEALEREFERHSFDHLEPTRRSVV